MAVMLTTVGPLIFTVIEAIVTDHSLVVAALVIGF